MTNLPRTSALARSVLGDAALWGLQERLGAVQANALTDANWQRAGKPGAPKPKHIEPPGQVKGARRFGSDPIPISEFDDWWNGVSTDGS